MVVVWVLIAALSSAVLCHLAVTEVILRLNSLADLCSEVVRGNIQIFGTPLVYKITLN